LGGLMGRFPKSIFKTAIIAAISGTAFGRGVEFGGWIFGRGLSPRV
jgi:hypothetical protein